MLAAMTQAERIYGGASRRETSGNRSDDKIDARWISYEWRQATEPPERRAMRYDTAKLAAYSWLYVDRYREWSRHRGAAAMFQ
jgi:hypothetical protein